MITRFGARLRDAVDRYGRLCVGIDPHASLLDAWGLRDTAEDAREFSLRVIDAAAGRVGVVKPQIAFFERFGTAGFAALEDTLSAARAAELLVIADAKRGDIGSTMDGYAAAWLSDGGALESDALTVSPYLGVGALDGAFAMAKTAGKGLFVLAVTSNPEAAALQQGGDPSIAALVAGEVAERNDPDAEWGDFGVVIGATVRRQDFALSDALLGNTPILAPGFGAQGAQPAQIDEIFGAVAPRVLANESRSILSRGADGVAAAIDASLRALRGEK